MDKYSHTYIHTYTHRRRDFSAPFHSSDRLLPAAGHPLVQCHNFGKYAHTYIHTHTHTHTCKYKYTHTHTNREAALLIPSTLSDAGILPQTGLCLTGLLY